VKQPGGSFANASDLPPISKGGMSEVVRAAGVVLAMQNADIDEVLIVREGTLLVTCYSAECDEIWSAVRGRDTIIGAEALRTRRYRFDAVALTEVRLLRIAANDFRACVGPADSPAAAIVDLLLREICAYGRDRAMTSGSAVGRVARLLRERQRMEDAGRPFEIKQKVLAQVLRLRPETLSRALAQLRQIGILACGPQLRVLDPHRLCRLADANDEESKCFVRRWSAEDEAESAA
jgi:CRP-like cAMP-binding protein